jgi:cell division protein FtsL
MNRRQSATSIHLQKINTVLIGTLIVAAVGYFFTVNSLSTKGFVFKELKEKVSTFSSNKQDMESQITALASYQNLNPRIQSMQLVTSSDIAYISWDSLIVARK